MFLVMEADLVHCLRVAVGGGFADSKMLRNVICGYILQNLQEWEFHVTLFHDGINTKQLYPHKMIERNWWATSAEIAAATVVLVSDKYMVQSNTCAFDIYLRNYHFQLLKPVTGSFINSGSSSVYLHPDSVENNLAELNNCCNVSSLNVQNT